MAIAISAIVAAGLRWLSGMPLWICWLIVIGAISVNGLLATWEDKRPRGFDEPGTSH